MPNKVLRDLRGPQRRIGRLAQFSFEGYLHIVVYRIQIPLTVLYALLIGAYLLILLALGIGTSLRKKHQENLFLAGHSLRWYNIGLSVFANNVDAIRLYKRLGFVEEGRQPREMKLRDREYADNVLMYRFV